MTKRKVYGDTDCLSSFLWLDEVSLLESLLDGVVIPQAVDQELKAKGTPLQVVENLERLKEKKFIRVYNIDLHSAEHRWYDEIRAEYLMNRGYPIGHGEAQAMAFAIENGGILASNNLSDIKYFVDKFRLPLLTSAYMIATAVNKDYISYEDAESTWQQMDINGNYLPGSFEDYYQGQYIRDFKEYGKRLGF